MLTNFSRSLRNLLSLAVSLFVLAGLVGVASADIDDDIVWDREPMRHQQQRQAKPPTPPKPVRHETKFSRVPDSKLQIRAVEYDGSTNGTLKVQLKNTEKTALKFAATGLYFVPEGDPDQAPQRLGAVGPMQLASSAANKELQSIEVPAGQTVEVALDVFCIDSHRKSPSPVNVFNVGAKRIPKELAAKIESSADKAVSAERAKGARAPRPAAKSAIQSEVWKSRDAKWIELDGEGNQEATK
ncbi:MAG: hypothetical protein ACKV2T_09355 [Kofleriaceae bacterium]